MVQDSARYACPGRFFARWGAEPIPAFGVYWPEKLACGVTPMYQFEENDDFVLKRALARAISAAQAPPRPINIKKDSARQFLTREILRRYREGEQDVSFACDLCGGKFAQFSAGARIRAPGCAPHTPEGSARPIMPVRKNSWTVEEDAALILAVEEKVSLTRLSARLRRTKSAVRSRAKILGLPVHKAARLPPNERHGPGYQRRAQRGSGPAY